MAVSIHLQEGDLFTTKLMDFKHVPGTHSAENIRKHYSDICAAWGLNPEDLFKTTADNASNMKKAFRVSIWDDAVVEEGHEDRSDDEDTPALELAEDKS